MPYHQIILPWKNLIEVLVKHIEEGVYKIEDPFQYRFFLHTTDRDSLAKGF